MWALTALLALAQAVPAQAGSLEVTNIRPTLGAYGPTRGDLRILPGDSLILSFDLTGLQADKGGQIRFETEMEVRDKEGRSIFQKDLGETVRYTALAGPRVRHAVVVATGLEHPSGTFILKVRVADRQGKAIKTFEQSFTVLPADFGLVRVQLSQDTLAQVPAPPVAVVGQSLYLNFIAVGFKPDPANARRGSLAAEVNVLDDQGVNRPLAAASFRNIPEETAFFPLRFELPFQRAGHLRLVVKVTDGVAKKTATFTFPITVLDPK